MENNFTKLAEDLQDLLKKNIEKYSPDLGIIRYRKIFPEPLFLALTIASWKYKKTTLTNIVNELAKQNICISNPGLFKRFNEKTLLFMQHMCRSICDEFIEMNNGRDGEVFKLTEGFTKFLIGDCTNISLTDDLKNIYEGCGGLGGESSLKVYCRMDILNSQITDIEFTEGKTSDQKIYPMEKPLPEGTLEIHDRGFYNMEHFIKLENEGCFYVSRVPSHVVIWKDGKKQKLGEYLSTIDEKISTIDIKIGLGEKSHPVRLVAFRAPEEVQRKREVQAKEKHRQNKCRRGEKDVSEEQQLAIKWTVFISNLPQEKNDSDAIYTLYRVRWQIELMFKLWKSEIGLDMDTEKVGIMQLCIIYAKMIAIFMTYQIMLQKYNFLDEKSPTQIFRVIKEFVPMLADGFYTNDIYTINKAIELILNNMIIMKYKDKRKKKPNTLQLLNTE